MAGRKDSGTWGLGDARSGRRRRQDWGCREVRNKTTFSASNESKVARSHRDRLSTGSPPSVCMVCFRFELET